MANFSKLFITDAGKRLLNLKLNAEKELLFTEMVMSGRRYDMAALEGLTDLEEIRQRAGIRKTVRTENAIRIDSVFLNSDLEEGYFANTLGVYARLGEDAPVLFAVAAEQASAAYMPQKSQTLSGMEIKLKITLENADNITIQMDQSAMATVGDVLELENSIGSHVDNLNNPHQTNKEQVGLGKVDNTSDKEKPVSTAQQAAIDGAYRQAAGYADQRIADLINGAPGTLDTLGEIARTIQDNSDVMETLEQAIGSKASQAEVDGHIGNGTIHITETERQNWNNKQTRTGDTKDNTATFLSSDSETPGGWGEMELVTSGEKHSRLFEKFSLAVRNLRLLWNILGTTDISGIGDGTVRGAIHSLNTGIAKTRTTFTGIESLGITSAYIPDIINAMPVNTTFIVQFGETSEIYTNTKNKLIGVLDMPAGILSIEKVVGRYTRTIISTNRSGSSDGKLYIGSIDVNTENINGWYKITGTLVI